MDEQHDLGRSCRSWCPVTDVDRAAAFYEDVLGLPLLFRYPGNAFFDAARRPALPRHARRSRASPASATIYFRVDDVTGTFERLSRARRGGPRARPRSRIATTTTTCGSPSSRIPTATTSG